MAIFSKIKPIDVIFGLNKKECDTEGRMITLEYPDFYLICVYVPNAGDQLKRLDFRVNSWDANMRKFVGKLKKANKNIIITGDFNCANEDIDVYDPTNKDKVPGFTPDERLNFKRLLKLGFVDTFRFLNPERVKLVFNYRKNLPFGHIGHLPKKLIEVGD